MTPIRRRFVAVASVAVLLLGACGAHSDRTVLAKFENHRAQFELLKSMSEEDSQLGMIKRVPLFPEPLDSRQPSPPLLSQERWNSYVRLFQQAEIEEGLQRKLGPSGPLWFVVSCDGLVTHGSCKGIIWSTEPLTPAYPRLDTSDAREQILRDGVGYRHIEGPWYMYEERS